MTRGTAFVLCRDRRTTGGHLNNESFLQALLRIRQPNLLLVGTDLAIDAAIYRLSASFATPVHTCVLPGPLALPKDGGGVLLLRDVAALDDAQQQELLRWLEAHHDRTQVVSATSTPLLTLVERGTFSEILYYRLNSVLAELGPPHQLFAAARWSQPGTIRAPSDPSPRGD